MTEAWMLTKDQFAGKAPNPYHISRSSTADDYHEYIIKSSLREVKHRYYAKARPSNLFYCKLRHRSRLGTFDPDFVGLCFKKDFFSLPLLVGQFQNVYLVINEEFRGYGLGAELIVRWLEQNEKHQPTSTGVKSEAGYKTYVEAHRILIRRALVSGQYVPSNVLKDYPELKCFAEMLQLVGKRSFSEDYAGGRFWQ